jgi:cyclophilin family peptidyl-prolyl cis-trans isomerase/HEAT repeat protein
MHILFRLLLAAAALRLIACVPPDEAAQRRAAATVSIDLRNARIQALYNFRDERRTDSLLTYLKSNNTTWRYLATLSFASIRDSAFVEPLAALLTDPVEEVRIAAAYALGQTGSPRAEAPLLQSFVRNDSLSKHQRFNATVLEAIGKCGSRPNLKNIAAVATYQPTDTLLLQGQCKAVLQYGLRKMTDPSATALMVRYIANEAIPEKVRQIAAYYFTRPEYVVTLDSAQAVQLAAGFVRAADPDIRMAIALALGKSKTAPAFSFLNRALGTEQDWRVQCNLISALAAFDYDTVRSLVIPLIKHANPHVSNTAAAFFINHGQPKDGDYYWRIARDNAALPWNTQVALYQASNRHLSGKAEPQSKDYINFRLREMFQQSKNPYERAACLRGLGEFGWNYAYIYSKGVNDAAPIVKTTAASILDTIARKPDFYRFFGENAKGVRRELYGYLREMIASGDPGMIAEGAARGLAAPALDYRTLRDSNRMADLETALAKLTMPKDYEAYNALAATIAFFKEGKASYTPERPAFNHPIPWSIMANHSQKTRATIQTSKGAIVIEFFPEWAPGSTANFTALAQDRYYNGKVFHRVVPGHVIQGGCPRGDGTGALDYSLRTEIGLLSYEDEGYIGMASSGPDTEGTQFFITHSPRPHLDGKYTLFGRVTQGMEVVHQIQQGDVIETVTVQ